MDRNTRDRLLKKFLKEVSEGNYSGYSRDIPSPELASVIETAINEDFVNNMKLNKHKSGTLLLDNGGILTTKGYDFIEGISNEPVPNQVFHIHDSQIQGNNFGHNSSITNNFGPSIDELRKLIQDLDPADQETAQEIVEIIENKDIKPGIFSRFTNFFETHPSFVTAVGKSVTWALTNSDKLHF
ncbi:TPA: hypothetical protein P5Y35_001318 [Enterococcus faecalis]|nr:hypothetical protein [Enterococcus faecalis]